MTTATKTSALRTRIYPETKAGGFASIDGAVQFYGRIAALTKPDDVVLELGAGRGEYLIEDPVPFRKNLRDHRGRCARVIGADTDPIVFTNPGLDDAALIDRQGIIPLSNASVDMVVAEAVFEHVKEPEIFASEIARVLKPGGWLCARTPNAWGYVALSASIVPNAAHAAVLSFLQPDRQERDIFPTHYHLNTAYALRRYFPSGTWLDCSYTWTSEPAYFGSSWISWRAAQLLAWLLPPSMATTRMIFMQRMGADGGA